MIDKLRKKAFIKEQQRYDEKLDKLLSQLPVTKKYPLIEPSSTDMLLNYTIFPEIKIYSTFLHYYYDSPKLRDKVKKGSAQVPRTKLNYIKPNTLLTVSLEVERILQHIYIDVNTLKKC